MSSSTSSESDSDSEPEEWRRWPPPWLLLLGLRSSGFVPVSIQARLMASMSSSKSSSSSSSSSSSLPLPENWSSSLSVRGGIASLRGGGVSSNND